MLESISALIDKVLAAPTGSVLAVAPVSTLRAQHKKSSTGAALVR